MSDELLPPDLVYYTAVAETQNNPEILKAELLDLIKEIKAWNTRPDSKPYKYATAKDALAGRWLDVDTFTDGFDSAREHLE